VIRKLLSTMTWPDHAVRWRSVINPFRLWQKVARLKRTYPESWRWILWERQIEGWLSDPEADGLFRLARRYAPGQDAVVVELGSWKGKSSVMLAGGLSGKRNPRLFCVDPFGQDESAEYQKQYYSDLIEKQKASVEQIFRRNIEKCGVSSIVTPIKGYSFEACQGWTRPIDILFIDANHEYEPALRDFETWAPFVKVGGVVAFHDANDIWPGVLRVIAEKLIAPEFGATEKADSLCWAVRLTAKSAAMAPTVSPTPTNGEMVRE